MSYGRRYVATRPVYVATLPVGHADGYPRRAVNGAKVLIRGLLYAVIGAVSASHTILDVGDAPTVRVGDVATSPRLSRTSWLTRSECPCTTS